MRRLAPIVVFALSAQPAAADGLDVAMGKALFERNWVPAPASTDAADGLGPLFNARSCSSCHASAGPARFISEGHSTRARGLVARFADTAGRADPHYGLQFQDRAVPGLSPEGRLALMTTDDGGLKADLVLAGPSLASGIRFGFRQAPSLAGRGAIAAIDESAILVLADPDDRDGDGISGRARMLETGTGTAVGRFGWKAAAGDIKAQVSLAFAIDMGLSSADTPLPHGDCPPANTECTARPTGESARAGGYELDTETVRLVTAFVESRGLAARQNNDEGLALFAATGCAGCHVPALDDSRGRPILAFSDLLLHDMGPGLDDGLGEPGVASSEWRTAPLIDLGARGGERRYLHDASAGSLDGAIRRHGGEAEASRDAYLSLAETDRARLVEFLEGL